jgi:hypothetical protein
VAQAGVVVVVVVIVVVVVVVVLRNITSVLLMAESVVFGKLTYVVGGVVVVLQ